MVFSLTLLAEVKAVSEEEKKAESATQTISMAIMIHKSGVMENYTILSVVKACGSTNGHRRHRTTGRLIHEAVTPSAYTD
jgi:hypothetical protein